MWRKGKLQPGMTADFRNGFLASTDAADNRISKRPSWMALVLPLAARDKKQGITIKFSTDKFYFTGLMKIFHSDNYHKFVQSSIR